ncbi:MAG: ABC transporter ATP-binding protein [Gammaproteobacteria bacterium]
MDSNKPLAIDVKNLKKSFNGKPAVRDVSLSVRTGEIFGFLGPNGSGKTTTIRMLCGLLTPDSGSGTCLGKDIIRESQAIKLEVGYMAQRFGLYDDLSIEENLSFIARLYGVSNRKEVVKSTIENLGLTKRAKQLAGTLSGGWKQRLALSAALLHKPKLLLLDEPTAGVDPKARRDFWGKIHKLATHEGITTLVSTHYMDEAERCHRLAYIADGKILVRGTDQEIIQSSNLTTWQVRGENLSSLMEKLQKLPGVDQTVLFGNLLHVSGKNADLLEKNIAPFRSSYQWQKVEATLEDVFISLVPNNNFDNHTD